MKSLLYNRFLSLILLFKLMYVVKAKEIVMSKENKSNSKYLNSIKDEQEKNQDKINVDRTYVEPQEFQSKEPKRQSSLFRFTVKQTS